MGAEIIKIETPPVGDISRHVPPGARDGDSLFYQCLNRGKKSITLDLRKPGGMDVFHKLLPEVDVLFANPKGTMPEKIGITYDHLKEYNPKLVCCFLTGYGRKGPYQGYPGYDYLVQALSGMVWMGGEPDGPPARCGVSVIDMAAGTNAAYLILAGIHQARITGYGCTVDTSLLEIAVSYANYLNSWHLTTGWEPQKFPLGAHQSIVPSQLFKTADSWLMVMAQQDKFFVSLAERIGLPDLLEDDRFKTIKDRYQNRDALLEILTDTFKSRTTRQWLQVLEGDVPVAPVNSIPEALQDPQVQALGLIVEYDHPTLGTVRQTGPPFSMNNYEPHFRSASAMGADTDAILENLGGFSKNDIEQLKKSGTI